jgi:iron complex outermembrane receptor protein
MKQSINRRTFGKMLPAGIALTVLACAINSAFAAEVTDLGAVGATDSTGTAAATAPSQGSLSARSAQSTVSDEFIRNSISPVSDYSQVLQMAPGMFSYSPNGVGLGDTKTTMRGYADGNAVISYDGIPFNDTNGVSHHSWVFFPSQFIGGAVIDRSPGSAATIGQATFAGSINLLSRNMEPQKRTSVTASEGTWNTSLFGIEHETGQFGADGSSNLLLNVHEMKSDGYETFNKQKRDAISAKYQYAVSADTAVTVFTSFLNLKTNTPAIKGVTRANVNAGNYTAMLSDNPTAANYYGFNFYNIYTDFNYVGVTSNLGNGWTLDDKVYVYRYWNKQNYNNFAYNPDGLTFTAKSVPSATNTTSGIDKLNSYVTKGNLLRLSQESSMGTLSTGLWYDVAKSYRYQAKTDPRTWADVPLPNFSETYTTTTTQPYLEFQFKVTDALKVTPGIKYASYKQDFNHLQDCSTVMGLGATVNTTTCAITLPGTGLGAASVSNSVSYNDVLPSLDVHYMLQKNWAVYGQYAEGDQIPDTGVFDVLNAKVVSTPKPTKSKTFQVGSVWKSDQYTLDVDAYHTKLDNAYTQVKDNTNPLNPLYTYPMVGNQIAQGIEAESNIILNKGFSLYLNGTYGSAKYDTGLWVAGAPADTETVGLNYRQTDAWNTSLMFKRVGKLYADNKTTHEAFAIDPVMLTNLFVNYTIKQPVNFAKQAKFQFGINNLFNKHSIVDVPGAGTTTSSSAAPSNADLLTVTPARSASITMTVDF